MQDFRGDEKKNRNDHKSDILNFIFAKFSMCYYVSPYILFYMHGPAILLCF